MPENEINELVKHLVASGEGVAGGRTATCVKAYELHEDQAKTLEAALEKAKATSGTSVQLGGARIDLPRLSGRADVARAAGRVGSRSSGQDVR